MKHGRGSYFLAKGRQRTAMPRGARPQWHHSRRVGGGNDLNRCPLLGVKRTYTVVWLPPLCPLLTQSGHWRTRNAAVQRRRLSPADIALCHSSTSSARNRREVGIVSLIYKRLRWGCASGDLVLRFGREIAGVMSFVQLFFKRPAGSVD